jgi:chromosome partitioning protein
MAKIISVANQKGGVGKTTSAINISSYLAKAKKSVLLIDLDMQGNATTGSGINRNNLEMCAYDVLINSSEPSEVILQTSFHFDVMPSTLNLAGAEVELLQVKSWEYSLKKQLDKISSHYDYILIDCPPSLGVITINALVASNSVIIPLQCEYYALEGITSFIQTFKRIQHNLNPSIEIEGVLLTMYNQTTTLSKDVANEIIKHFGNKVFDSIIPRNVRLSESPSYGKPIGYYDPSSKGAKAYLNLVKELISNE